MWLDAKRNITIPTKSAHLTEKLLNMISGDFAYLNIFLFSFLSICIKSDKASGRTCQTLNPNSGNNSDIHFMQKKLKFIINFGIKPTLVDTIMRLRDSSKIVTSGQSYALAMFSNILMCALLVIEKDTYLWFHFCVCYRFRIDHKTWIFVELTGESLCQQLNIETAAEWGVNLVVGCVMTAHPWFILLPSVSGRHSLG